MDQVIDIRAHDLGRRIVLREGNYRVWSLVLEESLREKKLWAHVDGTAVHPPPPRIRAPGIVGVPRVASGAPAVAALANVTQKMVEENRRFSGGNFEGKSGHSPKFGARGRDGPLLLSNPSQEVGETLGRLRFGVKPDGDRSTIEVL